MSGTFSPTKNGSMENGGYIYGSSPPEDISLRMRVPKRIKANGDVVEEDLHGGPNGLTNWDYREKFDMNVPDRIMLLGQDQHIGIRLFNYIYLYKTHLRFRFYEVCFTNMLYRNTSSASRNSLGKLCSRQHHDILRRAGEHAPACHHSRTTLLSQRGRITNTDDSVRHSTVSGHRPPISNADDNSNIKISQYFQRFQTHVQVYIFRRTNSA